jgi:hypothetical protein
LPPETQGVESGAAKAGAGKRAPADVDSWRLAVIRSKGACVTLGASHNRADLRRLARAGALVVKAVREA